MPTDDQRPPTFLCHASYFKGGRFLERVKAEGCPVYLLTVEKALGEPWPRQALDDVFAVPDFHDGRALVNAVAYLARSRRFDRIIALDDLDVETVGSSSRSPGRSDPTRRRSPLPRSSTGSTCGTTSASSCAPTARNGSNSS
jgi:hypothetical protein